MKVFTELILTLFTLFATPYLIKAQSDADQDRLTKLNACINLMKGTLHHDQDYFKNVANTIDASDKKDLAFKFIIKSLLNCYNNVGLVKAADLINKKNLTLLNPFTKDHKVILDIDNYHRNYQSDLGALTKDSERIVNLIKNYSTKEIAELDEMVTAALFELYPENYKFDKTQKPREEPKRLEEEHRYLSHFIKMDPKWKTAIGLGFLGIIALALFWGIRTLKKSELESKKKKKDKDGKKNN